MDLKNVREEYNQEALSEENILKNPIEQFKQWFQQAVDEKISYVTSTVLTTSGLDGYPHSRIVLIKEITDKGPIFFTNYDSLKGQEIAANPQVSMLIYWKEFDRQIRLTGIASKISRQASEEYFQSRSKGSQLSALASPQSQMVTKKELDQMRLDIQEKYPDENYPTPKNWGGYLIEMNSIEFWQGRPNRFHDRLKFIFDDGLWVLQRLAP